MRETYTIIPFLLVFVWSLLVGFGVPESSAQSGCGINVTSFSVLPSERTIDGVVYKRVQVVVNNPNPGVQNRFFYLIDDDMRDTSTRYYQYGFNTDEFLVPVSTENITFFDFNDNTCRVEYSPNLAQNACTFNVTTDIDLSEDCFHRTITYSVHDSVTIDSVAWVRNGGSIPVHDQMSWTNIPPGTYEVFFYDERGCEATSNLSTCTTRTDAGEDKSIQYCLGMDDTINLFDILDPDVDSGGFFTEDFTPVDSLGATQVTFQNEEVFQYHYIAPAALEIPDTSVITIDVRDCSVCEYELISAQRHCSAPDIVDVVIGGGSPLDSTFLVILPDGSSSSQRFFTPFQVEFADYQDSFQLELHMDTPTGVCDSIVMVGPVPSPMISVTAAEVQMSGDSVGVRLSTTQGMEPYQVDVFVGSQQKFAQLQEDVVHQFDFVQSSDTAFIMVMDDQGCMITDTLMLTPDCITPEVQFTPATCNDNNGTIAVDSSALPPGSQISWLDTNLVDVWNLTGLASGTYYYTLSYDDCQVEGNVTIDAPTPTSVQVLSSNECQLDGEVRFYLEDSTQVRGWSYEDEVLSRFSGYFPVNEDHEFHIQTMDGCRDTLVVRVDEPHWVEQIGYQQPNRLSAIPGIDFDQLSDFGWQIGDSILCHPCGDFESESMLRSGTYTFFAEQDSGCRRDTTIRVNQSEHQFLMPNVITPGKSRNNHIQIFDPLNQMASVMEFQVYDRFGNILFEQFDFYPDDDASIAWPTGAANNLPDVIVCVAKIKCVEGDEVYMAQDVLILR